MGVAKHFALHGKAIMIFILTFFSFFAKIASAKKTT